MDTRTQELNNALGDPNEEEEIEEESPDEEEETEEKEDEEEEGPEDEETEDNEEEDGEEEEPEDEEDDEDDDKKEKIKDPARWHGKSREDVIRELEGIEANQDKGKSEKKTGKKTTTKKKPKEGEIEIPSDEELSKMTPSQFVSWMWKHIQSQVSSTIQERAVVQQSVTQEIQEAKKDHPLLKTNSEYRELVLALIDNAAQKGVNMPLKEACEKVDAFSGTVKGDTTATDKEKTRMKKAKTAVERGGGSSASPGEGSKGAEKKRLESVFGTGGSKSSLGGLGV